MRIVLSLLLSLRLAAPGPEVSDRDTVQSLATRADEAFRRGDIKAAREALLEAIALEPDNMKLVFGLAQAERFLGNCERAVELFDRFLRSDPEEAQKNAAIEKRAECTDAPPPAPDPVAEPPPPIVEPVPVPVPAPAEPAPRRAVAGPVLVGIGAAAAIVGAALVTTAFVRATRAPDADTLEEYERLEGTVRPLAIGGWATLGTGLALAVTGGVVWGVQRKNGRPVLQIEARRAAP
jgi:tetratricopeptide (TPR) repeat protein